MYDRLLDTFVAVAEKGSFTKASDELFISPTGIMKQINALEEELNLKLLTRTPAGAKLTPAGESIYKSAKEIMAFSEKAIAEARTKGEEYETTFCVGTSLLNPAKPFMDLWYLASNDFAEYKLHLVPFDDDGEGVLSEIKSLGEKFDFLIGVCDSKSWLSACEFLPLGRYKKMVAVSRTHRLAAKKKLAIRDLYGETLMMVKRGDSAVNDKIRDDLTRDYPEIKIEDAPRFYDMSVFNRAAETNNVLLTIECWKDVHPALVTIPVEWDYTIPFGLLYAKNAPKDVKKFVSAAKKVAPKCFADYQ